MWQWSTNKRARASTPPGVNVQSTTTPDSHSVTTSDTWLYQHLIVDYTLGTLQALVHYVTTNCYADWMNCENLSMRKFFTWIIFNMTISWSTVCFYQDVLPKFWLVSRFNNLLTIGDRHWQKLAATFKKLKQIHFCSPCLFMWDAYFVWLLINTMCLLWSKWLSKIYRSVAKKGPWVVHITLCSDKGVGGYL